MKRFFVEVNGKRIKVSFYQWLLYRNQMALINRIEKKLDAILSKDTNHCANHSTDDGNDRAD